MIRDQLGSPLLVVNIHDEDDVLLEVRYTAFGQRTVVDGDGAALTLGFAGGIYDEDTGLARFGARDYDPVVGRWTVKDPILWRGGQGNLYGYVGGDPVNRFDPYGLYDYSAEETAAIVRGATLDYQNQSFLGALLSAAYNHSARGPLDFKVHADALDTFQLSFGRVRPDEFGNYLTGFATTARFGRLGELGTRLGGHLFAFLEGLFELRLQLDDPGRVELIDLGVYDAASYDPRDNVCQ